MEMTADTLKSVLHTKLLLYQDLSLCLDAEKRALVRVDMDLLWNIAEEKEAIIGKIAKSREELDSAWKGLSREASSRLSIPALDIAASWMDPADLKPLKEALWSLSAIKGEIRYKSNENKAFVESCLGFLDELFHIISGEGKMKTVYDSGGSKMHQAPTSIFLNQEV